MCFGNINCNLCCLCCKPKTIKLIKLQRSKTSAQLLANRLFPQHSRKWRKSEEITCLASVAWWSSSGYICTISSGMCTKNMAHFKRCILAVVFWMNFLQMWALPQSKSWSKYDCFPSYHLDKSQDKSEPWGSFECQHYLEGSLVVRSLGGPKVPKFWLLKYRSIKYRDLAISLVFLWSTAVWNFLCSPIRQMEFRIMRGGVRWSRNKHCGEIDLKGNEQYIIKKTTMSDKVTLNSHATVDTELATH